MTEPYRPIDPRPTPRGRAAAFDTERARKIAIVGGLALLALLLVFGIWRSTGSRAARHDLREANEQVMDKRREVEVARQVLEQRMAELREAEAKVAVENERLEAEMVRERRGTVAGGEVAPAEGARRP